MRVLPRWSSSAELRLAVRLLCKQPVVTLTTILALSVGIGMATAGFTLLDSVVYSQLPFPNGDRFVLLEAVTEPESARAALDADRFLLIKKHASAFEHLGAFGGSELNLELTPAEIVPVKGALVTPASLAAFPYAPVLGRSLRAEDGLHGATPVVMLGERLWRRHFSASPRAIGIAVTVSGIRRVVVGVMPGDFRFPNSADAWLPLSGDAAPPAAWRSARVFGVLRSGSDPVAANAQVTALSKQFETDTPAAPRLRINVIRFTDALSRGLEALTVVFVGGLVLVLLVIAANIANLVLARSFSRSRELAVRTALGATRARLVTQILTEVLILGGIAAAIGLASSQAALRWVRQTLTDMPFWVDFTASPRTIGFVIFATLLAVGVGGVLPALKATRRDTARALAATMPGGKSGFGAVGGIMVAVQVAFSIALLNGALVMARGVAGYMTPTLHVPAHELLTARVVSEDLRATAVVDAVAAMPGVASATAASSLPGLSPAAQMTAVESVASQSERPPQPAPAVMVDRRFFATFGATAQAGRLFRAADFTQDAPPVVVVNQPFVEKFFGGANPIGRRLRSLPAEANAAQGPWREIVGVVPDLGLSAGDATMAAGYYVPMVDENVFHVVLRSQGDARGFAGPLRAAISRVDPGIQVRDVISIKDVGREDRVVFAGIGAAFGALGGMALLLSVIATYAILSLAVTHRTREIGIRTALGATKRQIVLAVMRKICLPPALGAVAGIALGEALVAARGIFAFRLPDSSGPWGLPALGVMMLAAAAFSAWVPIRRALAIAPAEALRSE